MIIWPFTSVRGRRNSAKNSIWRALRGTVLGAEAWYNTHPSKAAQWIRQNISRKAIIYFLQIVLLTLATALSWGLRFDFNPRRLAEGFFLEFLIVALLVKIPLLAFFDLNRGWWRYSSLSDSLGIVKFFAASMMILAGLQFLEFVPFFSRSLFLIDSTVTFLSLVGARVLFRLIHESDAQHKRSRRKSDSKVIIVGAGDAGLSLLPSLQKSDGGPAEVVGFVDDSPAKQGHRFYGRKVLGRIDELDRLIHEHQVTEVYIAIARLPKAEMKRVTEICLAAKIFFKRIPSLKEILEFGARADQLQPFQVEDLLGREPVHLDHTKVAREVSGRTVLLTGAGGSIGSELCRQIMRFGPARVVALERSEYNLFQIRREIRKRFPETDFLGLVADIQDEVGLRAIFEQTQPVMVYHAAAHKHVPLREAHPREAVRNNVMATRILADLAIEFDVQKFLLISTDKAIQPINIMGYSKRLAELVIQDRALKSKRQNRKTEFVAVRFGNVLGSSGSAFEIFRKQIEAGGPVTITHPDCDRFFMTTPEAVEILLHACAHGQNGEIYMLDMGKPVKIVDLARRMIALADPAASRQIGIEITGLRPGKKFRRKFIGRGKMRLLLILKKFID